MKILTSKITPSPKVLSPNNNLFETNFVDCEYMTSVARPYVMGSDSTNFEVNFGIVESITGTSLNPNLVIETFIPMKSIQISLSKEDLNSWGENDEVCLSSIAQKLGVEIISYHTMNLRGFL